MNIKVFNLCLGYLFFSLLFSVIRSSSFCEHFDVVARFNSKTGQGIEIKIQRKNCYEV